MTRQKFSLSHVFCSRVFHSFLDGAHHLDKWNGTSLSHTRTRNVCIVSDSNIKTITDPIYNLFAFFFSVLQLFAALSAPPGVPEVKSRHSAAPAPVPSSMFRKSSSLVHPHSKFSSRLSLLLQLLPPDLTHTCDHTLYCTFKTTQE